MQLAIKSGLVVAVHQDGQEIDHAYPQSEGFEITEWDDSIRSPLDADGNPVPDPRTQAQRDNDAAERPLRRVAARMPNVKKLLYLLYLDRKNGTNRFVQAIDAVL